MSTFTVQDTSLIAVADAIRSKSGGGYQQYQFPGEFVSAILNIPSGGGGDVDPGKGQVHFIDYDGKVVKKWTYDDVQAAASLPDYPTHEGLTPQGWDWTLPDIQSYMSTYPKATLTVGQTYSTEDESTKIYIVIPEDTPNNRMTFPLVLGASDATIDWGDGSTTVASVGSMASYDHTYMSPGEYTITITGSIDLGGTSMETDPTSCIFGARDPQHLYNANRIRKMELGLNIQNIYDYAFAGCVGLRSVVLPANIMSLGESIFDGCVSLEGLVLPGFVSAINASTCKVCTALKAVALTPNLYSIGSGAFTGCSALEAVAIPSQVSSIDTYTFTGCTALASVTIPAGVQMIGEGAFQGCTSLAGVTIPASVYDIGQMAFDMDYAVGEYHIKNSTPPTMQSGALAVSSDCYIYVPLGSMGDYENASGWMDYAGRYMEE